MRIPLSAPDISESEIESVVEVLRSPRLSLGPKLDEFERDFASYIGAKHAVAVNSGTSGLHLCVKSLNLKNGDEIITTPFSFIASANVLLFENCVPVFVDIDAQTLNIDAEKIEAAITPKTKAIMVVHVFGRPSPMREIKIIAAKIQSKNHRRRVRSRRRGIRKRARRKSRRLRRFRVLSEQTNHDRRRRNDRHRRRFDR